MLAHCGGSTTRAEGPADATSSTGSDAVAEASEDAPEDAAAGCGFACDAGEEVALAACPASAPTAGYRGGVGDSPSAGSENGNAMSSTGWCPGC